MTTPNFAVIFQSKTAGYKSPVIINNTRLNLFIIYREDSERDTVSPNSCSPRLSSSHMNRSQGAKPSGPHSTSTAMSDLVKPYAWRAEFWMGPQKFHTIPCMSPSREKRLSTSHLLPYTRPLTGCLSLSTREGDRRGSLSASALAPAPITNLGLNSAFLGGLCLETDDFWLITKQNTPKRQFWLLSVLARKNYVTGNCSHWMDMLALSRPSFPSECINNRRAKME